MRFDEFFGETFSVFGVGGARHVIAGSDWIRFEETEEASSCEQFEHVSLGAALEVGCGVVELSYEMIGC